LKGKGKSKAMMIGRGIITSRPIDGTRYLTSLTDFASVSINYTPSRKEVKFHQLMSKSCVIPHLKNYYEMGTKFVAVFGEVACFECLIAESHLGIDELGMENDIDDVLGENKTEDLGDREPGSGA
jgi:hypothetical protein